MILVLINIENERW